VTFSEANSVDQGLPALAVQPIGEAKHSGMAGIGRAAPATAAATSAEAEPPARPRQLRIGDKVRSLVDDVCVSVGLTGLVVNVAPPRYGAPARARILWDNETVSMADAPTFELLSGRETTEPAGQVRVA
jgi:hypothetical protein